MIQVLFESKYIDPEKPTWVGHWSVHWVLQSLFITKIDKYKDRHKL